jgi:hypothetical protein
VNHATDPVRAAIAGELRLLDPGVRGSAHELDALLDPEFAEIGASGRIWDRAAIIEALTQSAASAPPIDVTGMAGVLLAPGIVHLTFATDAGGRRAHRSSLWRLGADGWRIYFHQATPVAGG